MEESMVFLIYMSERKEAMIFQMRNSVGKGKTGPVRVKTLFKKKW